MCNSSTLLMELFMICGRIQSAINNERCLSPWGFYAVPIRVCGTEKYIATRRAKMRKKISKVWGKIRKIDQTLRKKWGKWNSCPLGTVRLATALCKLRVAQCFTLTCFSRSRSIDGLWYRCTEFESLPFLNAPLPLTSAE